MADKVNTIKWMQKWNPGYFGFTGLPRRLRATTLLWKGNTQAAVDLLQDDVLVADPGTK